MRSTVDKKSNLNSSRTAGYLLTSFVNRYSGNSPSFLVDICREEQQRHEHHIADSDLSQPSVSIMKSRTFSVISSITQSFSGSTLGSQKTSRNLRRPSEGSTTTADRQESVQSLVCQQNSSAKRQIYSTSLIVPTSGSYPSLSNNPKEVTTAMPPQYWAGRFMALQDRFRNELLESHGLVGICGGQSARPFRGITPQAPETSQRNTSTSVYDIPHLVQVDRQSSAPNDSSLRPRIPHSSTTGATMRHISYNIKPSPSLSTQTVRYYSNGDTATVNLPYQNHHGYTHLLRADEDTLQVVPSAATPTTVPATVTNDKDDASHAHRVLAHLETLCTTDVARASLRQWRTAYAHKMDTDGRLGKAETEVKASSMRQKQKQEEKHRAVACGYADASVGVGR